MIGTPKIYEVYLLKEENKQGALKMVKFLRDISKNDKIKEYMFLK